MQIYLAEKRTQGVAVAQALGGGNSIPQGIKTRQGIVTWAQGHLLELAPPDAYDEKLKRWDLAMLPIMPKKFKKHAAYGKTAQLKQVLSYLKKASAIYICTDPAREGELIARELITAARVDTSRILIHRVWTSSLTQSSLQKAIQNPLPGAKTEPHYLAGKIRERADWLIGMNGTRALTVKCRAPFTKGAISVGRVQTPTLTLVVLRENEIQNFKPETFFTLAGSAIPVLANLPDGENQPILMTHPLASKPGEPPERIPDPAEADRRAAQAMGATAPLQVTTQPKKLAPPRPFELATLQIHANRKKGWTADKTLKVAQELYEKEKAISYPRTDGDAFSPGDWPECMKALARLKANEPWAKSLPDAGQAIKRASVFSDKRLEGKDHHALMPTPEAPPTNKLNPDQAWLFQEIARRYAAQFLPDEDYLQTTVRMDANGIPFEARGRTTTFPGWKILLPDYEPVKPAKTTTKDTKDTESEEQELQELQNIPDGTPATMNDIQVRKQVTKPPAFLTEASLIALMRKNRIGTKATWAATIELLKRRDYIRPQGRKLLSSPLGRALVLALQQHAPEITQPEMTAKLEKMLDEVVEGTISAEQAEKNQRQDVQNLVHILKTRPLPELPPASQPDQQKQKRVGSKGKRTPRKSTSRRKAPIRKS